MKVLLIKDVGGLGQRGQIKEVADGYAFNYLIARGLAEQATPDKVKKVQAQMEATAASGAARDAEYAALAKKLDGSSVAIESKANEKGHLYKQLPAEAVVSALKAQHQVEIAEESVHFEKAIRETGDVQVVLKLGAHTAHVTLSVRAV